MGVLDYPYRKASGEAEMYRIAIADVAEGARLGVSVFNETGRPLVKAGVALTAFQLDQVEMRGYTRLVVLEPDEEIQPEFLPPEIRAEVIEALRPVVDFLVDAWRRDTALKLGDAQRLDLRLRHAVSSFVKEAGAEDTLTLPGSLRIGGAQWLDDAINAAAVAVHLGNRFGCDDATLARLAHGMLLRDVGMLSLDPEIIGNSGPLSAEARDEVRKHPMVAYRTLSQLDWLDETARLVILQHHERHDGSGYPHGLNGLHTIERTPSELLDKALTLLVSEIAAVADVFNALTVDRPHRTSRPPSMVRNILSGMAGVTLNAEVVGTLLDHWQPPIEYADEAVPTSA